MKTLGFRDIRNGVAFREWGYGKIYMGMGKEIYNNLGISFEMIIRVSSLEKASNDYKTQNVSLR